MKKPTRHPLGLVASCLLLLIGGALLGCGKTQTAEDYVKSAKAHREAGDLSAAIIDVKNALQQEPRNLSARLLLAAYDIEQPDATAAEAELNHAKQDGADPKLLARPFAEAELLLGKPDAALKATEFGEDSPAELKADLLGLRAQALMALNRGNEAREAIDEALRQNPNSLLALIAKARYAIAVRDIAGAKETIAAAQRQEPKNATLWSLQGLVTFTAGDFAASEQAYQKMLEVAKWNLQARIGLARALIAEEKLKEAEAQLAIVLKAAPNDPNSNYLRALAAYRQRDYQTAEAHLQRALRARKDYLPAVLLAGATAYALKQYEQANNYLTPYVYQVPQNVQARKLLAAVQVALGRSSDAVKTLSPVAQGSNDAQLLGIIGMAEARSGDLEAANRYLARAVEQAPENAALRTQLGVTQVAVGNKDAGIAELEQAAKIDPKAARPEIALFATYLQNKEYDKALDIAERLQKSHPNEAIGFDFAGLAYLGKGDNVQARAALNKARQAHPGDPIACRTLASMAVREGDIKGAGELYAEILKANPKDAQAYLDLAAVEGRDGHTDDMQATLERAIKENPDEIAPRVVLARLFLIRSQNREALNAVEPIVAKFPKDPAALEIVGRAQLTLGNIDAARAAFRTLIEVQPKSSAGHRYLSEAEVAAHNPDLALTEARKAVEVEPKDALSRAYLARLYMTQKKFTEARGLLVALAGEFPQDASIAELQATVALELNQPEEAVEAYKRALPVADSAMLRTLLAAAQLKAGHAAEAELTLLPWVEAHPDDVVTHIGLGDLYLTQQRLNEAEKQYLAILEKNPNNVIAENNLAWVLSLKGQGGPALEHARHAAALAPTSPEVLDTLGVVLLQNRSAPEAVETLKKATQAAGTPAIQFHLAQAFVAAGNKEEARGVLRKLLDGGQNFAEKEQAQKLLKEL